MRSAASASGVVALIGSDTASKPASLPSTARCITLAPCARSASACVASADTSTPSCCISAVLPSASALARDGAAHADAGLGVELVRLVERQATIACAAATMAAASGCSLPWSRLAARRSTSSSVKPGGTDGALEAGAPLGQRAGLVDDQRVDLAQVLDRRGVAEQHAAASRRGRWRP